MLIKKCLSVLAIFSLLAPSVMVPVEALAAAPTRVCTIEKTTEDIVGLQATVGGTTGCTNYVGNVDGYTVGIDWGDGGVLEEFTLTNLVDASNNFTADWSGDHTYATSGVYDVVINIYHQNQSGNDDGISTPITIPDILGVSNNTPPVITIIGGDSTTTPQNSTYTDEGATASDTEDGDLTLNIITTGLPINTTATGTYAVVYSATDFGGLIAYATRTVNVIEVTVLPSVPTPIDLLSAGNFAILAETEITDANPAISAITGNVGLSAAAGSNITGLSCSAITGSIYDVDGTYTGGFDTNTSCLLPGPGANKTLVDNAVLDMMTAYTAASNPATPAGVGPNLNIGGGTVSTQTLATGVYTWDSNVTITGDITLAGSASDVWIFQINGTLDLEAANKILLTGGAQASNIFWQVTGATTLKSGSTMEGTILDQTNIAMQASARLNGRALAQTAVTLIGNTIASQNNNGGGTATGTLTVIKQVVGGTATSSDFTITVGTSTPVSTFAGANTPGTTITLDEGSYTVGEVASSTYTATFSGNCNTDGQVVVSSSSPATCTITNTFTGTTTEPTSLKVKIYKYLDGIQATAVAAGNYLFPMQAAWNTTNIGAGSGNYVLGNSWGSADQVYAAFTSEMSIPTAFYTTREIVSTDADSSEDNLVLPANTECTANKFRFKGYTIGNSLIEAQSAESTSTAPSFTDITTDKYVIVWNEDCDTVLTPNLPPVLEILGANPFELTLGNTFVDPFASSTDPEDGDITNLIATSTTLNTNVAGNYDFVYSVTDSDGAMAYATRTISVIEVSTTGGGSGSSGGGGGSGGGCRPCYPCDTLRLTCGDANPNPEPNPNPDQNPGPGDNPGGGIVGQGGTEGGQGGVNPGNGNGGGLALLTDGGATNTLALDDATTTASTTTATTTNENDNTNQLAAVGALGTLLGIKWYWWILILILLGMIGYYTFRDKENY